MFLWPPNPFFTRSIIGGGQVSVWPRTGGWRTSGDLEPIFTLEPGCCCLLSAQCWQMQPSRWHQHNVPSGQWSHGSHGAPGNIGGHVTWSHWSSGTLGVMRPCQVKSSLVALFCDPVSNPLRMPYVKLYTRGITKPLYSGKFLYHHMNQLYDDPK